MSEFISLYSGSSGNCSVVRTGEKYIIIDMGKGVRTTSAALKELGLNISDCEGILVTHEHSDHVKGLATFLKKNPLPVYGADDTLDFLDANEHREYTKQLVANSSNQTQAPENVNPTDPGINTDWQDAYLRNSPMYNLNAAISGGGEYSTFNTSIGYFDQQGIMEFSGFKKYNARVNGTFKKGRLTVSETLSAAFLST